MNASQRIWFLLRKLDKDDSIFFPIVVEIEEDEPALFGAAVSGLDNRLAAMGRSAEEAEQAAVAMFKDIVDHALETNTPLGVELGRGVPFTRVNLTFGQAEEFFAGFAQALKYVRSIVDAEDTEDWRLVPTTALVASASAAHV